MPCFARARDGVEFPDLAPRLRVIGRDEAAYAQVAASRSDVHLVPHHQWRHGDGILRGCVGHRRIPQQRAVLRVDSQQMCVHGAQEQCVAEDGKTAVDPAAARARGRGLVRVGPEDAPGDRIQRHDVIRCLHRVEHTVHHQRCRFELFERMRLPHPLQFQVAYIARIDLIQRAVTLVAVVARIAQPVGGLRIGAEQLLGRHLR